MRPWNVIKAAAHPLSVKFRQALHSPQQTQLLLLQDILKRNRNTVFGRRYCFDKIRTLEQYREYVPIHCYEHYANDIADIANGATGRLVTDEVIAFEATGGSSGGAKLIPYTRSALDAFRSAVLPWLADLATIYPSICAGRAYFAVSPATRKQQRTACGLPIGLASDVDYLGYDLADAFVNLSAVPPHVAGLADVSDWLDHTILYLLAADDLSFVSIWSPSFFLNILRALERDGERYCRLLAHGYGSVPACPARVDALERSLLAGLDTRLLWPELAVISAWADASSAIGVRELRRMCPHAHVQGKGLLATEGVMTLPLEDFSAPVPALASTVLEFVNETGSAAGVSSLEVGQSYRVVITTWGGLYRYDIGDRVLCCGYERGIPLLRFIGRAGIACDLTGEKLTEEFVADCLQLCRGFAVLVPVVEENRQGYVLVIERYGADDNEACRAAVEARLCRNPQYAYSRHIGQLLPLALAPTHAAESSYYRSELESNRRLSDIKNPILLQNFMKAREMWPDIMNKTTI